MKHLTIIAAVACAAVSLATAADPPRKDETLVRTKLSAPLSRVVIVDQPLAEALVMLGQVADVTIDVDWASLKSIGIKPDAPVTLHLRDQPADKALRLLLLGAAGPGKLGYVVRGATVRVATPKALKALPPLPKAATQPTVAEMPAAKGVTAEDRAAIRKLRTAVPVLAFENARLGDAMLYIREISGVTMYVDWAALAAAGAKADMRLSATASNTTAGGVLQLTLAKAAPGKLNYTVAGGVVLVATPDRLRTLAASIRRRRGTNSETDRAAAKGLLREVPLLKRDEVALQTIITFCRRVSEVDVYVNWRAVEAAGIKRTTPVSLDLKGVSPRIALILAMANAAGPGKLDFDIADGRVIVSTAADTAALAALLRAAAPTGKTDADKAIAAKLETLFPTFDIKDMSLKAVVAFIREASGADVFVDWRSLRAVNIRPDTRVSLELHRAASRLAIHLALTDAGGTGAATYTIYDGVVYIATAETVAKLAPTDETTQPAKDR